MRLGNGKQERAICQTIFLPESKLGITTFEKLCHSQEKNAKQKHERRDRKKEKPSGLLEWFLPNLQLKLYSFSEAQGITGLYRNKGRTLLLTHLEICIVCKRRVTSASDDCSRNGLHQR